MTEARRRISLAALGVASALLLLASGVRQSAQATQTTVISVDSARVTAGGTSESQVRVSAPSPGVAAFFVDVLYDVTAVTMTDCKSSSASCNIGVPGVVRFAGVHQASYQGEDIAIGKLIFSATGAQSTTHLTIDKATLGAWDPDTREVTGLDTKAGTVSVVDAIVQGDVNCNGILGVSDALADLRFAGTGKFTASAGCSPPGNLVNGKVWGDQNGNGEIDGGDALDILLKVSQIN